MYTLPDPIAPSRSATIVNNPMQTPPQNAATGIYPDKYFTIDSSLNPLIFICMYLNNLLIHL